MKLRCEKGWKREMKDSPGEFRLGQGRSRGDQWWDSPPVCEERKGKKEKREERRGKREER